jgi:hypothetical protein
MTKTETALLLAQVCAFDRRTVGESDVTAWQAALDDIDLTDAQLAVTQHYRESTEWLMVAHVRAGVRRLRAARLAEAPEPVPEADPDDVVGYQRALRAQRLAAASGKSSALVLGDVTA